MGWRAPDCYFGCGEESVGHEEVVNGGGGLGTVTDPLFDGGFVNLKLIRVWVIEPDVGDEATFNRCMLLGHDNSIGGVVSLAASL